MKYSENEMAALISEVEAQFSEHLAKAEIDKTDIKKSETASKAVKVKAEATTKETSIEKSEETKVEAKETEATEFNYNDEDFAEMDKLYGSMTKAEAEAHYKSVKKAVFGSIPENVEKTEEPVQIAKSETKADGSDLRKSNEELKAENDKLQKNFKGLVEQLAKFVKKESAPKQKAITRIEYIAKTEEKETIENKEDNVAKLSADDIKTKLSDKIRSGSLKKSDRETINSYYLEGGKNIETIRHLL